MKLSVYAIKDHKTTFMEPMTGYDDVAATRSFAQAVNADPVRSMIAFQPSDYDLFRIGEFDTVSGILTSVNPIEFVINGQSLVGG